MDHQNVPLKIYGKYGNIWWLSLIDIDSHWSTLIDIDWHWSTLIDSWLSIFMRLSHFQTNLRNGGASLASRHDRPTVIAACLEILPAQATSGVFSRNLGSADPKEPLNIQPSVFIQLQSDSNLEFIYTYIYIIHIFCKIIAIHILPLWSLLDGHNVYQHWRTFINISHDQPWAKRYLARGRVMPLKMHGRATPRPAGMWSCATQPPGNGETFCRLPEESA
jgi:hypothetical protein